MGTYSYSSDPNVIKHDFRRSRERSLARHNAHLIHRRIRKQLLRSSSGIGLVVVVLLLVSSVAYEVLT